MAAYSSSGPWHAFRQKEFGPLVETAFRDPRGGLLFGQWSIKGLRRLNGEGWGLGLCFFFKSCGLGISEALRHT